MNSEQGGADEQRERAVRLFLERWLEQLGTSFVPRRARSLGPISALDELLALAEASVRSGGQTRPGVDPEEAGHGVLMLPDVADEAASLVSADAVLGREYATRKQVLVESARKLAVKDSVTMELIEQIKSILAPLRREYLSLGFRSLTLLLHEKPKAHEAVVQIADALISELRVLGWSDEALHDAALSIVRSGTSVVGALSELAAKVGTSPKSFECYVGVILPPTRPELASDEVLFSFVDALPAIKIEGRPLKAGPYLKATIAAHDPAAAAVIAHQRTVATLGALKVFLPGSRVDVSSDIVGVLVGDVLRTVQVQERLLEEPRFASDREVARILTSSWKVHELRTADPLHDAIRLRHRALTASDAESRLLLLWSGLERMTSGARGFGSALNAARELVSHAVGFGKLRRDVADLIKSVQHHLASDPSRRRQLLQLCAVSGSESPRVDRIKFLEFLMADEPKLRQLTSLFYEESPLLAYRCHQLWRALGAGVVENAGSRIADYHERSRDRVSRQIARIYRARNRIAHVGASPDRVRDLVWHAHFYLTQLTAICVHYGEHETTRAQELLVRRVGQYKAFISLLKAGDATALTASNLLRPSSVVG